MSLYDPTTAPVDHIIAALRDRQGYATRTADSWSRSKSPRSEQYAQRDREVVARLDQLIRAIEAGLFDQLDAAANEQAEDTSVYREGVDREQFVEYATDGDGFSATLKRYDGGPVEYYDAQEAADVLQIEREMAIEAGDDSEIDRLVAEDDARAEAKYLAGITTADRDHAAEHLARAEHAAEQPGPYTRRQIDGVDCHRCGLELVPGQPIAADGEYDGEALYAHMKCIEAAAVADGTAGGAL